MTKPLVTIIATTAMLVGCASHDELRVEEITDTTPLLIDLDAAPGPASDGRYHLACDGCPASKVLKWYQSISGQKITMPTEIASSKAGIFVSFSGFTKTEALDAFRKDLERVGILLVEKPDGSMTARKKEPNRVAGSD